MPHSSSIRLYRAADIWMDRNRLYKVVIDGSIACELWPNQNIRIDVPPGQHNVRVKIDVMGSNEMAVQLEAGEVVELACRGNGSLLALFNTLFRRNSYLDLHFITPEETTNLQQSLVEPPAPRDLGQ